MPQPDCLPQIRHFDAVDLEAILRLFRDTVHRVNRRDYSAEQVAAWAPEVPDRKTWLARLAMPWTLVAEERDSGGGNEGGKIVGFGQLRPDGRIDLLYVDADRLGQGIGRLLLARLVELAGAQGLQELTVEASITARPFFQRHGFAVIAEQRVQRRGVEFVNYRMERET